MTPQEQRALRAISNRLTDAQREILWWALGGEAPSRGRSEMAAELRLAADKLERLDD